MGTDTRRVLGWYGEEVAANFLTAQGWRVLERNWRCAQGELDLVALPEPGTVVFVEVKTRSGDAAGPGEEAVTPRKLARLRRLAASWMDEHRDGWPPGRRPRATRIDVIAVSTGGRRGRSVTHFEGVEL
jgi:putative endonuclease